MITQTALDKYIRKHGDSTDPYVQMGIKWLKGEIIVKEFNGIKLTPKQIEFVNDKSSELLMSGGFRCLSGDTKIYNASTGREERIDSIKSDFKVLSMELGKVKKAQALKPELVGSTQLIEIKYGNKKIKAHPDHLILTPTGYKKAKNLTVGESLVFSEVPRGSIEESFLSGFLSGALHLLKKSLNYLASCLSYCYLYGVQLLGWLGIYPNVLPLRVGALSHTHSLSLDVPHTSPEHNHLYPESFRPSKNHGFEAAHVSSEVNQTSASIFAHIFHSFLAPLRFLRMFYHHLLANGLLVFCPYLNPTTQITSIKLGAVENYYDLHVIGTHNYFAQGIFHHNCGKTVALAIKLWLICQWFPQNQILLGRKSRTDLDATTLATMFEMFPSGSYKYKVGPGIIEFPNGSLIHCKGLDTDAGGDDTKKASQKIKGMTLGGAALDQLEEIDQKMYTDISGRMTINIPYRPIFCTTNPATYWAYEYFKSDPQPGTNLIETGMLDNAENLPEGFIDTQMLKPRSYVERFVLGIWDPTNVQEGRVFPDDHLTDRWCKDPVRTMEGIKIFEEPKSGGIYQLGIDPAAGGDDPAHMTMIDKVTGREVANFHGKVPVTAQIEAAQKLCIIYSISQDVMAIPEVNGVGQAFIEGFKKVWNNIYMREIYSKRDKKTTDKLGWYSSHANKTQIIESMKELLTYGFPKIADRETLREFQMFIYSNDAKKHGASCPHPYHDDRVMATLFSFIDVSPKSAPEIDEEEFSLYGDNMLG